MNTPSSYDGQPGWYRQTRGPGAEALSSGAEWGSNTYIAGVQCGNVDKASGQWIVWDHRPAFMWRAWRDPVEFVRWQESTNLPKTQGRRNLFEHVGADARLVFQVIDPKGRRDFLQDLFVDFAQGVLPALEVAVRTALRTEELSLGVDQWRFVDTAQSLAGPWSFRAYHRTLKLTERARLALLDPIRELNCTTGSAHGIEVDFASFCHVGNPVLMPKCRDGLTLDALCDPITEQGVARMLTNSTMALADYAADGFYEPGLKKPLHIADLTAFSFDARYIEGAALDVPRSAHQAEAPEAPEWLAKHLAPGSTWTTIITAAADRQQVRVHYPQGTRCPAGLVHDAAKHPLCYELEADGSITVECSGPSRGDHTDLQVLDSGGKAVPGQTRCCGAFEGLCTRKWLAPAPLRSLFAVAEELPAEQQPDGRLCVPKLTASKRDELRNKYGKRAARYFVLTHVCGSGKTRYAIIGALVETVLQCEKDGRLPRIVAAAPTRKLVASLKAEVDEALAEADIDMRCTHYIDGEDGSSEEYKMSQWDGGVLVTCTHSLWKLRGSGELDLLVSDEVDEGINSVAHLMPDKLHTILAVCKQARTVIWADAMAGATVTDALAHLDISSDHILVLDTTAIRPYTGARTRLIVPLGPKGQIVEDAAVYEAIKQAQQGRNVLFVSPTVAEVRVLQQAAEAAELKVAVAHSWLPAEELKDFLRRLRHCRRSAAHLEPPTADGEADQVTEHQIYAISPVITSGVNSRNLFDVVIACGMTCSVSPKVIMQMIQRARDPDTEVLIFALEHGMLRPPGGTWKAERINFDQASVPVQAYCREHALADVETLEEALGKLTLGDTKKLCSPRGAQDVVPSADNDDAHYACTNRGRAAKWYRFTRVRGSTPMSLDDAMREIAATKRMASAVLTADRDRGTFQQTMGEILVDYQLTNHDTKDSLQRVLAHRVAEKANRTRYFLRTIEAIALREKRDFRGPEIREYTTEELAEMKVIEKVRFAIREADFRAYVEYEAHTFRVMDKLERYKAMEAIHFEKKDPTHAFKRHKAAEDTAEDPDERAARAEEDVHIDAPDAASGACSEDDDGDGQRQKKQHDDSAVLARMHETIWAEYLTYGPAVVAVRNDSCLDLMQKVAAEKDANKLNQLQKELKTAMKLIRFMRGREALEAYRILSSIKLQDQRELTAQSINKFRNNGFTQSKIGLAKWLAVHELLQTAGWKAGIFDDGHVTELMTTRSGGWRDAVNAREQTRAKNVAIKLRAFTKCADGAATLSAVKAAIKHTFGRGKGGLGHFGDGLGLDVVNRDTTAATGEWVVQRTGVIWSHLDGGATPEFAAFWKGDRLKKQGYYAKEGVEVRI